MKEKSLELQVMEQQEIIATAESLKALREINDDLLEDYRSAAALEDTKVKKEVLEELRKNAKTLNDIRSTKDRQQLNAELQLREDELLEKEKELSVKIAEIDSAERQSVLSRGWDKVKTFGSWAVGLATAGMAVWSSQKNLEVAKQTEQENYLGTTAEKEAVKQGIDVHGKMSKLRGYLPWNR